VPTDQSLDSSHSPVSRAVWPWWEARVPVGRHAGRGHRVRRAAMESCIGLAVGLLLLLKFRKEILATVVFSISGLTLIGGLFIPPLYRGIQRVGQWLGKVVGVGITWILLVPFFYICFPLGRVFFTVAGKDPIQRRFSPEAPTYWVPRKPISGPEHFHRQY
jgi:hypothetical protein